MGGKPQDFGSEVADWLGQAILGPDGRERMPKLQLAKLAGISPDTLYRMLRGEGGAVEETTLAKLGKALGVGAPVVVRMIVDARPESMSASGLVREAQARLDRALALMDNARPQPRRVTAGALRRAAEEVSAELGHQRGRRSKAGTDTDPAAKKSG